MIRLPEAPLERVLRRCSAVWGSSAAPVIAVLGQTGSGKTTLVKHLMGLRPLDRTVVFDPKMSDDPIWRGPDGDPDFWGLPVPWLTPRFGFEGTPGGGPGRMRFRVTGSPDRDDTAARFEASLAIAQAEGRVVAVLEDYREQCRQLRLSWQVDSLLNLGRSSNMSAIVTMTETSWAAGRAQAGCVFVGLTAGLEPAKAAAALLGKSGRAWYETTEAIRPHEFIYSDNQPGSAGPVLTRVPAIA